MAALTDDLQAPKHSLDEFAELAQRVLAYLPNVISTTRHKSGYSIMAAEAAGTSKFLRPVNDQLFLADPQRFEEEYLRLKDLLHDLSRGELPPGPLFHQGAIDAVVYTIQQSIGAGLDLLGNPNSARKHVGNRFEELIGLLFTAMGIANKKMVLKIPYETDQGEKQYKCENDLVLSPYTAVQSGSDHLDEREVVVSLKTTSKDRMGKIFIDKLLLQKFVGHPQKMIGIFLNDVQRKEEDNISFTLVSGLFMVYSNFLTEMEGVYYVDPPPITNRTPYNKLIRPFSTLLLDEVWTLLGIRPGQQLSPEV